MSHRQDANTNCSQQEGYLHELSQRTKRKRQTYTSCQAHKQSRDSYKNERDASLVSERKERQTYTSCQAHKAGIVTRMRGMRTRRQAVYNKYTKTRSNRRTTPQTRVRAHAPKARGSRARIDTELAILVISNVDIDRVNDCIQQSVHRRNRA